MASSEEPQFLMNEFLVADKKKLEKVVKTLTPRSGATARRARFLKEYTFALFRAYTKQRVVLKPKPVVDKNQIRLQLEQKKKQLLAELAKHQEQVVQQKKLITSPEPAPRILVYSQISKNPLVSVRVHEQKYFVQEPSLNAEEQHFLGQITLPATVQKPEDVMIYLQGYSKEQHFSFSDEQLDRIRYYVIRDQFKFGVLSPFFEDPEIHEVLCSGPDQLVQISFDTHTFLQTNLRFSVEEMNSLITQIAKELQQPLTQEHPFLQGTYEQFTVQANLGTDYVPPKFLFMRQ